MQVLIVGSGGREHAIAWKAAQSPFLKKLYLAPGNAGTQSLGEGLTIAADNFAGIRSFALQRKMDLVLVGPEAPLADGLADYLNQDGIPVFGPSKKAAQIEASKAFAKAFMERHAIPTARYATFTEFDAAHDYLKEVDYPIVIKASGLAAGKGVVLPGGLEEAEAALRAMLVDRKFGAASQQVVIEQRLEGEEVSLLAFTDGKAVRVMPPAQDHKRLLDGDQGPNTGGMGAYAPVPFCPSELVEQVEQTILQPTIDGLRSEGSPFVGVLYAGLILTDQGPQVLEFNCRFGDPETQVLLPLLETDLLEIAMACVQSRLKEVDIRWKAGAAACVVLASPGYPGKYPVGHEIKGLENESTDAVVFHAGTRQQGDQVLTDGGRVLGATGWGADLRAALDAAYRAAQNLHFAGMQYRTDIGQKGLARAEHFQPAYTSAGVDIDAGNRAVELMGAAVRSTYGDEVLQGIGAFGGLYDATALKTMQHPVLVASTDGVGTKIKLAAQVGRYTTIGVDIVNHCINDILVQGARPLFFLDYFAAARLEPEVVAEIVSGMAGACREAGCALIGGETAEMPGVYAPGGFDVAGSIVGVVEGDLVLPHSSQAPGDLLLGLRSSGPHTNGYTLIRKVFENTPLETVFPELGLPLADALLAPHRSYLATLQPLVSRPNSGVKALAHITGGGFIENIPRVLPEGVSASIHLGSWPVPAVFGLIQATGRVPAQEMYRVFNMGIGMVVITSADQIRDVQQSIPEETWVIGELVPGERKVILK